MNLDPAVADVSCPICSHPLTRLNRIRPGYLDKVWVCANPDCRYGQMETKE